MKMKRCTQVSTRSGVHFRETLRKEALPLHGISWSLWRRGIGAWTRLGIRIGRWQIWIADSGGFGSWRRCHRFLGLRNARTGINGLLWPWLPGEKGLVGNGVLRGCP